MQPPVAVPANGGPLTLALVTRPDGANVMTTLATPEGSPSFLQAAAWAAPAVRAAAAAARSKGPAGSVGPAGAELGFGSLSFGSSFAIGSLSGLPLLVGVGDFGVALSPFAARGLSCGAA